MSSATTLDTIINDFTVILQNLRDGATADIRNVEFREFINHDGKELIVKTMNEVLANYHDNPKRADQFIDTITTLAKTIWGDKVD